MLDVTVVGWAATIGLIAVLFVIDLFVSRPGHAHEVGFREAALASVFYVSVAIAFGVVFGLIAGWDFGAEYFAGYIVEKSLSVDNLFVFVVIMTTFRGARRAPAAGPDLRHPRSPPETEPSVRTGSSRWCRSSCPSVPAGPCGGSRAPRARVRA